MAAHVDSRSRDPIESVDAAIDKSGWTDLQGIQYRLGIWDGIEGHPVVYWQLPEWKWEPNDEWRKLRGILSGHPEHDTISQRRADREWELEHDRRKFGTECC